jgi:hypothetical protein
MRKPVTFSTKAFFFFAGIAGFYAERRIKSQQGI